ncbi:MAG: hypothetical protein IJY42_06725 [Clostridia bacterium]|nr:hypothetical protein [Clostridia bacterium]
MKEKIARFLYGRYGNDTLGTVLLWTVVILLVLEAVLGLFNAHPLVTALVFSVSVGLLVWMYSRMLSRNVQKRRRENQVFCGFFLLIRNRFRDRKTHVYRKCPHCKAMLRLPKAKGKHTVCCPRCHDRFETKG